MFEEEQEEPVKKRPTRTGTSAVPASSGASAGSARAPLRRDVRVVDRNPATDDNSVLPAIRRAEPPDADSIAEKLKRANARHSTGGGGRKTMADAYMHRDLSQKTRVPTPFTISDDEQDIPILSAGKAFGKPTGPFISGRNRPQITVKKIKQGKVQERKQASTSYYAISQVLDDWCKAQTDPNAARSQLADELITFSRSGSPDAFLHSTLFAGDERSENARKAANYLAAILVAAEPHEERANADGGKFERGALGLLKKGYTFMEVFGDPENAIFIQAQKSGNRKFKTAMNRNAFHEGIDLSDSSDEGDLLEDEGDLLEDKGDLLEDEGDLLEDKGDLLEDEGDLLENETDLLGDEAVREEMGFDAGEHKEGMREEFGDSRRAPVPHTDIKQIFKLPSIRNIVGMPDTPEELLQVQREWQQLAIQYLEEYKDVEEKGEIVEKAAFVFRYRGEECSMPIDMVNACFSWECSIDLVRQRLYELGAEDVVFYPGLRMYPRRFG